MEQITLNNSDFGFSLVFSKNANEHYELHYNQIGQLVFSADLYRGNDEKECDKSNINTVFTLENKVMNYLGTSNNTALLGLLDFIIQKGYSLLRVNLTKSAASVGKEKKYVGYGSFILVEEDIRIFLTN